MVRATDGSSVGGGSTVHSHAMKGQRLCGVQEIFGYRACYCVGGNTRLGFGEGGGCWLGSRGSTAVLLGCCCQEETSL